MVDTFFVPLLLSALLGFLSGLGVGGGSLLMLWLTAIMQAEPGYARGMNLLFFLPSALIASFFRLRQGKLPLKMLSPALVSGCICAVIGTEIGTHMDNGLLRKGFAFLLLFVGIREILYRPRKLR